MVQSRRYSIEYENKKGVDVCMKAARKYDAGDIRIEDLVLPPLQADDVKIAVEWAGICGSDKHSYERSSPFARDPFTVGHEFSGTVIEVGGEVARIKVGDRVIVNPLFFCGKCPACLQGYTNLCENLVLFGLNGIFGAFAEETTVKENMVYKIPDNLPLDVAAVSEPTCIAAHALRISKFKPGDTAAVFGVGAIGLLMVSLLKASGCTKIIATARTASKLALAKELGADITINPNDPDADEQIKALASTVDVAFELSGAQQSVDMAMRMLRVKGELCIISLPAQPIQYNAMMAIHKEITVTSSQCSNGEFPMVAELLASGAVNGAAVITKKIHLDDLVKEGFETLIVDSSQLKILVTPKRENLA